MKKMVHLKCLGVKMGMGQMLIRGDTIIVVRGAIIEDGGRVCVCVCVCVRERERERERAIWKFR